MTNLTNKTTLLALCLVTIGCGAANQNKRSLGSDDQSLNPRKVHGSDNALPGEGTPGEQPGTDGVVDDGTTDATDGTTDSGDGTDTTTDPGNPPVQQVFVKAGLRNYEQINATMSTVTGVPRTNAVVSKEYKDNLSSSLPTDNDIRAFLGSQQVAVFKLAVEYCDALVKDPALRTNVFGAFNFAAAPATSLNAAGKLAVADALVTKFWGKGLDSLPAHAESTSMVVAIIDELLVGKTLTTVALTPAVVTGACTATLASAPVTVF